MLLQPGRGLALRRDKHRNGGAFSTHFTVVSHLEAVRDGRLADLGDSNGHLHFVPESEDAPEVDADVDPRDSGDDLVKDSQPIEQDVLRLLDEPQRGGVVIPARCVGIGPLDASLHHD